MCTSRLAELQLIFLHTLNLLCRQIHKFHHISQLFPIFFFFHSDHFFKYFFCEMIQLFISIRRRNRAHTDKKIGNTLVVAIKFCHQDIYASSKVFFINKNYRNTQVNNWWQYSTQASLYAQWCSAQCASYFPFATSFWYQLRNALYLRFWMLSPIL